MLTRNVLAVYLIHESGIGRKILHENIFHDGVQFNIAYILAIVAAVVVLCVVIEEIRRRLFNKWENQFISKFDSLLKLKFLINE